MPFSEVGQGALSGIGKSIKQYGDCVLLAIDPYIDEFLGKKIERILISEGIHFVKTTDIQPNPSCFAVDDAAVLARQAKCNVVLAVGGGSAIDFGKAVAIVALNPGKSWNYTKRKDHTILEPESVLPLIAVPTTAGTGTEATACAVLNNPSLREKSSIINDKIFPVKSFVDPELMVSMPSRLTASTGFDAFSHCLEAYISNASTPFARMVAHEGMRIISKALPVAVKNGGYIDARTEMAWGSLLGGAAISTVGAVLPHAMGQPVGGFCNAPHGETIAACMVEILKYGCDESKLHLFADIADILDSSYSLRTIKQRAAACPELVASFLSQIGLNVRFSDFGLSVSDIDKVTDIAMTGYYFDIQCHPKKIDERDIKELYRRCI